jgi:tetratricopeptide (TPR) repeat protein
VKTTGQACIACGADGAGVEGSPLCPACALRGALAGAGALEAGIEGASEQDSSAADIPPPFGDFEPLEEIGRGGMGIVYRARQVSLDRVVAIKMLLPGAAGSEALQRFRAEAAAAAAIQHPHIVAIHQVGTWQGQPYIVLDLVRGRSLARYIVERQEGEAPDFDQIATWASAIAAALQCAHDHGVLHRDVKPSNILIDESGDARLTDFGLAKRFDAESTMSVTGHVVGSPSYMPPEQAESGGERLSRRSDVYGLGATLYHLLTGRAPFMGETPGEVLHQVVHREPIAPRRVDRRIPADLETICLKCLEKDPGRRYPSARTVADELRRFLERRPILARPVGTAGRLGRWCRRKPAVAASLAAALVAIVAGTVLGLQLWQERVRSVIETGMQAIDRGDHQAAAEAIRRAERLWTPMVWVEVLKGRAALFANDFDGAIAAFERALAAAPGSLPAKSMLATACLWSGRSDRYEGLLRELEAATPRTAEDFVFLGEAMLPAHPDTSRAVTLLEKARQTHPSGIAFLQLSLAEAIRARDIGSCHMAGKALDDARTSEGILGVRYPNVLNVRLNALNYALEVCPAEGREDLLERAAKTVHDLESLVTPIGRMQRGFYFQIVGDAQAETAEWRAAVQSAKGTGLYAAYYASAMLARTRSAEALDVLHEIGESPDAYATVSRAYLLLDVGRTDEAWTLYRRGRGGDRAGRLLAETVALLAGSWREVAGHAADAAATSGTMGPDRAVLEHWAGRRTAEDAVAAAGPSGVAQCRAHYLVGLFALAKGDRALARDHFEQGARVGTHFRLEHQMCRALTIRLQADPRWPAWIPM